ncbi:hypothetical protein [Candidatus Uabimicrobium sp. HlEnr_7]|uniref:hypothetical protein n=1 Tax=Candidatus Uabimicrobium helgolandensis TaxID=3095367 RepID=UPI003556DFE0
MIRSYKENSAYVTKSSLFEGTHYILKSLLSFDVHLSPECILDCKISEAYLSNDLESFLADLLDAGGLIPVELMKIFFEQQAKNRAEIEYFLFSFSITLQRCEGMLIENFHNFVENASQAVPIDKNFLQSVYQQRISDNIDNKTLTKTKLRKIKNFRFDKKKMTNQ